MIPKRPDIIWTNSFTASASIPATDDKIPILNPNMKPMIPPVIPEPNVIINPLHKNAQIKENHCNFDNVPRFTSVTSASSFSLMLPNGPR